MYFYNNCINHTFINFISVSFNDTDIKFINDHYDNRIIFITLNREYPFWRPIYFKVQVGGAY